MVRVVLDNQAFKAAQVDLFDSHARRLMADTWASNALANQDSILTQAFSGPMPTLTPGFEQDMAAGAQGPAPPPPTAGAASPPLPQGPMPPAASPAPPSPAQVAGTQGLLSQPTPPQAGGRYSPFDDLFRKHAGPLNADEEFLRIVAAGTNSESGWNPRAANTNGEDSHGIFQMNRAGGAGTGYSVAQLQDPDFASSIMVPAYARAYMQVRQQNPGLTGAELASLVAAMAERPQDWQNPQSQARRNYADAYTRIAGGGGPQAVPMPQAGLPPGAQQGQEVLPATGGVGRSSGSLPPALPSEQDTSRQQIADKWAADTTRSIDSWLADREMRGMSEPTDQELSDFLSQEALRKQSQPPSEQPYDPNAAGRMLGDVGGAIGDLFRLKPAEETLVGRGVRAAGDVIRAGLDTGVGKMLKGPALLSDEEVRERAVPGGENLVRQVYGITRPGEEPTERDITEGLRSQLIGASAAGQDVNLPKGAMQAAAGVADAVKPHGLTINLPKFMPEEVRQVIQQSYDAHPEIMDASRRGVVPDDLVREMAEQIGADPKKTAAMVNFWKPGQAKNAETILAMRQALADTSQSAVEAQQRVRANPADAQAANDLVGALTRQAAVQEAVTGVTAEAGRALRQFRQTVQGEQGAFTQLSRLAEQFHVKPEELAQNLAKVDLSDPRQVANVARSMAKFRPGDYVSALWYFNLLSSPLSHVRNVVSNTVTSIGSVAEAPVAATIDAARVVGSRALGKDVQRQRYYGETGARAFGMVAGLREGVTSAVQILARGFTDASAAGKLADSAAIREVQFPAWAGGKVTSTAIAAPSRALGAEDAFFRTINKTSSLYALAYRKASQEGLKGTAFSERVAELRLDPDLLTQATEEGAFRVFQADSDLANKLAGLPGYTRFLLPFIRTPINVTKYMLQNSPAGFGTLLLDAGRKQVGAGQAADRLARAGMGTAVFGMLYQYAREGNLTGAAPPGGAERDAFMREHPQYSFRIGDTWYSYQALQPFSALFATAASIAQAEERGQRLEASAAFTMGAFAVAKSMLDMPWTAGLADALDALGDPQQAGPAYARQLGRTAAFPTALLGWVNRATDAMVRQPQDFGQSFVGNYPGMRDVQPTRLSAWGQDVKRPDAQMGIGALNPFNPTPVVDDPVDKALNELQMTGFRVEPGFVGETTSVPLSKTVSQSVTLSDAEQRQIQRVSGQLAYGLLLTMVTSPGWQSAPPQQRQQAVNQIINKTREYARAQLMPQLAPRAVEAFRREMSTGVRRPAPAPTP